jgi:hypothetical protein
VLQGVVLAKIGMLPCKSSLELPSNLFKKLTLSWEPANSPDDTTPAFKGLLFNIVTHALTQQRCC